MKRFSSFTTSVVVVLLLCIVNFTNAQLTDPSFFSPEIFRPGQISIIKRAAKGKTYMAGDLSNYGDKKIKNLVRLTANGLLDSSFNPEIPDGRISAFDVLPSGNLVVGILIDHKVYTQAVLYVLAVNGRKLRVIENNWGYDIPSIKALPDNRFLVAGFENLVMFKKNFEVDTSFGPFSSGGPIDDIELQGSKFIITGDFGSVGPPDEQVQVDYIARVNPDGTVDQSFINSSQYSAMGLFVQPDGKILIENGDPDAIRLNANGSKDISFNCAYPGPVTFAHYENGIITLKSGNQIVRVNEDGSAVSSFQPISLGSNADVTVHVLQDESLLLANYLDVRYGLARFNRNGVLTNSYKAILLRRGVINSMVMDGNSIVIGGDFVKVNDLLTYHVAKLHSTGKVDKSFMCPSNMGPVHQVGNHGNGNILAASKSQFLRLTRYGKHDPSFVFSPFHELTGIKKFILQKDRKIIAGGPESGKIYRLNYNGTQDDTFSVGSGPHFTFGDWYTRRYDFDLDKNSGKIVYYGYFDSFNGLPKNWLVRLESDGSVDASFNEGTETSGGNPSLVRILENGEILVAGRMYTYQGNPVEDPLFKVNSTGVLDMDFAANFGEEGLEHNFTILHPFRDKLLLAENRYYSGFFSKVIDGTGQETDFDFPSNIAVNTLTNYFSRDNESLFLYGSLMKGGVSQQIVKLIYPNESTIAQGKVQSEMMEHVVPDVTFYPNPASDFLQINSSGKARVRIFDLGGQLKISTTLTHKSEPLNLGGLAKGRYLIVITSEGKTVKSHLIKD